MTSDEEQMTENGEKLKTHVQDVRSVQGVQGVQTWVFFFSLNIQIYGFFVTTVAIT